MSRMSDLARLVSLRTVREERAKAAVTAASARLSQAARALADKDAAIDAHDAETGARERRFFETMRLRPLAENELGRAQDSLHALDHRREVMIEERAVAVDTVSKCEQDVEALRLEWRRCRSEREKLVDLHGRLSRSDRARAAAISELEAEDMSADRMRS